MKRVMTSALLAIVVLASHAAGADKALTDLNGAWEVTSLEQSGVKLPAEQVQAMLMVLTMKDGKFTTKMGSNEIDKGTYKAGDIANSVDIASNAPELKGKTIKALYKLDGQTLTVAYDLSGGDRPTEFTTKAGTQLLVETYRKK
jgi:uncharacterized protein (TIGR03067 family)